MASYFNVTPTAYNVETKGNVYDYAIFIDRYRDSLGNDEYCFETLLNSDQVMYEDTEDHNIVVDEHTFNLRLCTEYLLNGIDTFALVEIGPNHGKVLRVLTSIEVKHKIAPEHYEYLIETRNKRGYYAENKKTIENIDKKMQILQSQDVSVYTLKFDVIGYENFQTIKEYLKLFDINIRVNGNNDEDHAVLSANWIINNKLKKLEKQKENLLTPGVIAYMDSCLLSTLNK